MTTKLDKGRFGAQRTWGDIPHVYHAFCREIRRHLRRRGWSLYQLDDAAGLQDGYAAKMLSPASKSGRVAGYDLMDFSLTALAGRGYRILVVPANFDATDPEAVATLLDDQDEAEAERVAALIDYAARTNRIPKFAV